MVRHSCIDTLTFTHTPQLPFLYPHQTDWSEIIPHLSVIPAQLVTKTPSRSHSARNTMTQPLCTLHRSTPHEPKNQKLDKKNISRNVAKQPYPPSLASLETRFYERAPFFFFFFSIGLAILLSPPRMKNRERRWRAERRETRPGECDVFLSSSGGRKSARLESGPRCWAIVRGRDNFTERCSSFNGRGAENAARAFA